MQHWYVYHSTSKMEQGYASLGESAVYSAKEQPKLLLGDVIWVIEGPGEFSLVDCFLYSDTEYPPFSRPFSEFRLKIMGKSMLPSATPLSKSQSWFGELHSRFITKQKFFSRIEAQMAEGLMKHSGVTP